MGNINIQLGRIEKRRALAHLLIDRALVDICVVTETRFLEGRGEELMEEVFAKNYKWLGRDRKKQKAKGGEGGVGILMRKGAGEAKLVKVSEKYDILWVEIKCEAEIFLIAGVYLSPEYRVRGRYNGF